MKLSIWRLTSWRDVLDCARLTSGQKPLGKEPSDDFKHSMCISLHSPLRALRFRIDMEGIPTFVSTHLVRHKIGAEHYVQSQRPDRNKAVRSRHELPQDAPVNHSMDIDAEALIRVSHRRLCAMAAKETREVWRAVIDAVGIVDPILAGYCVPLCEYLGWRCPEPKGCGRCVPVQRRSPFKPEPEETVMHDPAGEEY